MRLTLAPSSGTSPVSKMTLRVPLEALLFLALTLPAISGQEVTIPFREHDFIFSDDPNYEFDRICQYQGPQQQLNHLEWLLNGTVFMNGTVGATPLQLLINPVTLAHAGLWECRAVLSDGTTSSSANAGTLTVYDPNDVIAPPQQSALIGRNYTLDCTSNIEGVFISWQRDGEQALSAAPLTISSVQLSDEGLYNCRASINGASISKPVQFNVIVPPKILSQPPPRSAFSNEQVTLTVTFESHQESTTSVKWFKNNIYINSTNITTRYGPAPNATTELRFQQITRDDQGRYHVEIENTAEAIPSGMRRAVSSFEVEVTVPPSRPTDVTVDRINDTHVHIRWTLTNLTADAGAEVLKLHLQDHPDSPFELDPNQEEWILCSEPGMMYNLTLKAINPDGTATTNPMAVKLPATAPSVERLRALQVNDTAFNFTLEVFYTGGGDLEQFIIQLRSGPFTTLTVTPVQSQTSPRLWYAVIDDPDVFDGLEDPQFNVNIVNAMQQSVIAAASGESVFPGPPSILLRSRSSDSLTVEVQLSDIGTAPILMVEVNVTLGSQLIERIERSGNFIQGELINIPVTGLQPGTEYTFTSRAVNELGTGDISTEFQFTTNDRSGTLLPPWAIIAIAVGGSVVLTVLCIAALLCLVCCCCRKNGCCNRDYTEKYCPTDISAMHMPEEIKTSAETLNSTSHRGSVRGGVVGNYTSVSLTPRSPTIESCDSPYIKQRFESVTDSDGSRSDIHMHQPYVQYRHYTYSHSPGPIAAAPAPINLHHNERLSRSLTGFDEPTSPQDITHQATMV